MAYRRKRSFRSGSSKRFTRSSGRKRFSARSAGGRTVKLVIQHVMAPSGTAPVQGERGFGIPAGNPAKAKF